MEYAGLVLSCIALVVIKVVACVLVVVIAAVICMTMWAIVKPSISALIDRWMDWVDRRTSC